MQELEEQLNEDPDIDEGKFFFTVNLCPKTEREAMLMQARKLESVINEESEEYDITQS